MLFITHDFGVVAEIADRVAVMQPGRMVETGPAPKCWHAPQHPYTRALVAAVPPLLAAAPAATAARRVLAVEALAKTYRAGAAPPAARTSHAAAGRRRSFSPRGETLGIVGESGSGKSTARALHRSLADADGRMPCSIGDADLRPVARRFAPAPSTRIQMVFQDPFASLNPRRRVGD